jgi:hypothetical protein
MESELQQITELDESSINYKKLHSQETTKNTVNTSENPKNNYNKHSFNSYVERMRKLRMKNKEEEDRLETKPGSGKNWRKNITVPDQFLLTEKPKRVFHKTISMDGYLTNYVNIEPLLTQGSIENDMNVKVNSLLK